MFRLWDRWKNAFVEHLLYEIKGNDAKQEWLRSRLDEEVKENHILRRKLITLGHDPYERSEYELSFNAFLKDKYPGICDFSERYDVWYLDKANNDAIISYFEECTGNGFYNRVSLEGQAYWESEKFKHDS